MTTNRTSPRRAPRTTPDRSGVRAEPLAPLGDHPGVVASILETARRVPDRVAVDDGTEAVTYGALVARAGLIAGRLLAAGVGPGDLVGVAAARCTATLVSAFGVLAAGAVYVPLLPELPSERLRSMAAVAGLHAVVGPPALTAPLAGLVREVDNRVVETRGDAAAPAPTAGALVHPALDSGAYVIFTSGSTGAPKGVRVPHRALANLLGWYRTTFTPAETALVAATTSFGFDPSILQMFGPLDVGGTVRILPNVLALADIGPDIPVTLASGVPSALAELVRLGRFPPSLRTLIVGGERMPASLARRLYASSSITRLQFVYGPTEATVQVITAEVGPDAVDPVLIGRPMPGVGVHVTDAELKEVPDGDLGELCLSGIQLADGYIGRDDLTAERFVSAPPAMGGRLYRTGDLGRRLADGTLEFRGRMDDQVKIRGQRVEPGEVQAHLAGHPAVSQAHVGFREGVGGTELVAWAAPLGESVDPEELRDYLRRRLPAPLVPSVITVLDTLPVGPRGKLDVARLPPPDAPPLGGAGSDGELLRAYDQTVPPSMTDRDALVEVVSAAVAEVLGTATPVRPDDDFFDDLGGTSLLAVRLVARLEEVLSVRVPLSLVLGGTTIAHLADALVGLQGEPVQLVVNGRGDDVPLVLVHAWIGGVLRYRLLAPYLPPSQPLIGIAVNHDVQGSQPHTIDALAEQALVQLRTLRPTGPYLLGGHSAGGLIALEMARRLRVEGAEVGEVLLIDTPALVSGWRFWRSEIVLNWDDWKTRSWSERVERVQSFISNRRGRIGTPSSDDQDVQWRLAVTNRSSMRAIRTFEPAPYDGDVLVLYTSDSKRRHRGRSDLGWGELVRGTLTAEPIGGTHDTIFAPANAPGISAHLLGAARRLRREVSA